MNLPDVTFKCRVAGEWIDKTTNETAAQSIQSIAKDS